MKKITLLVALMAICVGGKVNAQIGKLLFSEEFNGTALNTNIWNYDTGRGANNDGWGNWELEYYTDNSKNVKVENGNLVLTAIRENYNNAGANYIFTSGRINSENKLFMKYGMVEIKAKLPKVSNGVWPAIWMMGNTTKGWPTKGEVDIMEAGFTGYTDNMFATNIHWDACDDGNWCPAYMENRPDLVYTHPTPLQNEYLIYRFYWFPGATPTEFGPASEFGGCVVVVYNTNGDKLFTANLMNFYNRSEEFQNPLFLIFNMAVGGNPTGISNQANVTALPTPNSTQSLYVDYIRMYEYAGKGEVKTANDVVEHGKFGVFADGTTTDTSLLFIDDKIDVWGATMNGVTVTPFAGTAAIGFESKIDSWGGMAIRANVARNMSNYNNGELHFKFKHLSPDAADRNRKLSFGFTTVRGGYYGAEVAAGLSKYGFGRDLDVWYDVVVPMSNFAGADFSTIAGMFAFVVDPRTGGTFKFALDEVYWTEGALAKPVHSLNYGIYHNEASTDYYHLGVDGELYIWGNTMNNVVAPEGYMTLTMNGTPGWSGLGFTPKVPHNLAAFANGNLIFDVKTTNTSTVSVGMAHRSGGNWVTLSPTYGYVNDGQWHTVTIPMSALSLDYYKLQDVTQLFQFLGGVLTAPFNIDKVRFEAPAIQICPTSVEVNNSTSVAEGSNVDFTVTSTGGVSSLYQVIITENGIPLASSISSVEPTTTIVAPTAGSHTVDVNLIFDNSSCNQTIQKSFTVTKATGLASLENKGIYIYPNPVREILNVVGIDVNASCKIYNSLGLKVMESTSAKIDVSSLQSGVYILQSETIRIKFIKE